ncbi:SNF2-related [Trypanosoma melophagium]|uniref:SNF2-related n=1 Tax=Trypanosoma melophagium TaxID=715481 RepID=UPI003519FCB8|nr:SNF2-related [Trypanosoma melophagium]
MNCYCGSPVKCIVSKAGGPGYSCALGRCRFFALGPVQTEGYRRLVPHINQADDCVIVRFEAALHPVHKTTHVTASVSKPDYEVVCSVLEDSQFHPFWYVAKEAYLYPMESYNSLVSALKRITTVRVMVQEIPLFFFRCLNAAEEIRIQHERNVDGNASQNADVEDVVYSQLRPFQKQGVDFIISRSGRGMIADDMGLGKTIQAIAVAHHYRDEWPVLIVCPLSLVENWAKEFTRFCGIPAGRIAILQTKKVQVEDVHSVVIVPYSSLKCLESLELTFKVVILDESHYIKNVDSKRTMAALKLCRAASRVLLLSGTPTLSRPIELYPQLQSIMHPSWTPTKTQFGARYCNAFIGRFGVDYTGHSNMSELHVLLQQFVIRRTKREMCNELPSKSRQLLYVYVTPKEKKALEKSVSALRDSIKESLSLSSTSTSSSNVISSTPSRGTTFFDLKIATARAKIAAVQDYVRSTAEQMVESRQKMIVFAHHQCMMEAIRGAVESVQPKQPLDYIYITGDTPSTQRETLTTHFRSSPNCHVAVLSMLSCGVGHNLTCATMVVFAELDWNPSTHMQCEDRVHRMGQSSPCVIKYLLAEGTSDTVIWPMLHSKLTVTHAVLEDITAGGEGLSSGADTHRIIRSDIPLTPISQEKKQVTLDGFLGHSGSRSRPATQNSESGGATCETINNNNNNNKEDPQGHELQHVTPCKSQISTPEETSRKVDNSPLLDIKTLQQMREAKRAPLGLSLTPKHSEMTFFATTNTNGNSNTGSSPSSRQAKLHEVIKSSSTTSVKSNPSGRTSGNFRISVATNTLGGISPSTASHTPVKLSVADHSSSITSSYVPSSTATNITHKVPIVAVNSEEPPRIPLASRSEELRLYKAKRTLFVVGGGAEKRPRQSEDEKSTTR